MAAHHETKIDPKWNVVYDSSTPAIYDDWAKEGYNEAAGEFSRGSLESVSEKSIQHLGRRTGTVKVMDAGTGTGNVAEVMEEHQQERKLPFKYEWHGLDFSQGMLDVAATKGIFVEGGLKQQDLKAKLDYEDEAFDLIVSAGTFLQGHVGCEAVPEMCRILRPRGLMVFTVRPNLWAETKEDWQAALAKHGMTILGVDSMPYAKGMEAPVVSAVKGPMEMKVSNKKGIGFYVKAARAFLTGVEAQVASEGKEAREAKPAIDAFVISGLGDSINVAVAAATAVEAAGLATITKVETGYPEVTSGRGCAHISIAVQRKV